MKINELKNMKRATEMPIGTNEVVFDHIDYREDKETGDINGIFVHTEGFKPLFIPFFDNGQNYQLDLLLDQLGVDSYDPDDINECKGTVISATRYIRETETDAFTNVSFNKKYSEEEQLA